MTAIELAKALLALPEEMWDLPVFSTADWEPVVHVGAEPFVFAGEDQEYVEIG